MEPRYKLLEDLPLDAWLYLKEFLRPADVENILATGSRVWEHIFKDTKWLEFAHTFDRCSPFLLGYELSKFRPNKDSNNLYLALQFFASLQEGWTYDSASYEVRFPSGLVLNVHEVLTGVDDAELPIERIFTTLGDEVYTEYSHYADTHHSIKGAGRGAVYKAKTQQWDKYATLACNMEKQA
ncbi:uncharacterized protein BDV17DRAFT_283675 [Aspergillus undulatus]|uniref:uncharacterized protein n=1 Tax=Aspergillus undulatus TaxID=1810928 RepID=UPI003CCD992C